MMYATPPEGEVPVRIAREVEGVGVLDQDQVHPGRRGYHHP
jgi:hypothetical protein